MATTTNVSSAGDFQKQQSAQSTQSVSLVSPLQAAGKNDVSLTLEQYRALVGMPQEPTYLTPSDAQSQPETPQYDHKLPSHTISSTTANGRKLPPAIRPATVTVRNISGSYGPHLLIFLGLFSRPSFLRHERRSGRDSNGNADFSEAAEYATSLYYTLVREESDQWHLYHFYNVFTYTCLIFQLIIASALMVIGAIAVPGGKNDSFTSHRIAIAVLGAVAGVLTGLLSLLKGQGLPTRLLQYANRLRQVRDKIEFLERALRANLGTIVTYQDVVDLRDEVETVRSEWVLNRPDVWTSSIEVSRKDVGQAEQALAEAKVVANTETLGSVLDKAVMLGILYF